MGTGLGKLSGFSTLNGADWSDFFSCFEKTSVSERDNENRSSPPIHSEPRNEPKGRGQRKHSKYCSCYYRWAVH